MMRQACANMQTLAAKRGNRLQGCKSFPLTAAADCRAAKPCRQKSQTIARLQDPPARSGIFLQKKRLKKSQKITFNKSIFTKNNQYD
jgi:hypothetical protein